MKRSSVLLTAAMLLSTVAASANPFSDVATSHWAYDAVNKLAAKGILQGYPDGTFKGNKAVTRYALAMVTAKMVANVEQMLESGVGSNLVTKSDLQTLEKLTVEFADELALLGVKVTALEDDMQVVKEDVSSLKKDVDGIKDYMAKGGVEKVKISGDMLVRHQNMTYNQGSVAQGATRNPGFGDDGMDTYSQLRLTFKANIDENVEAVARWYMTDGAFNQIPRSESHQYGVGAGTDNSLDIAYLKVRDMFRFGGDFTFGRNYYHHGHNLVLSNSVDAVRFDKRSGDVDVTFQYIYDAAPAEFNGIWNLNLDTKYRDHDIYFGFYSQHNTALDGNRMDIELGAKGPLGNNGHWDYDLGFVFNSTDKEVTVAGTDDLDGLMAHVAVKWDSKKEWAAKLAYTYANDENQNSLVALDNDARYCDGIETPFEDISRGNIWFTNGLQNANLIKVQAEYRPRNNSKHYFRLAGDFLSKADDDKAGMITNKWGAKDGDDEAMVATFEYRYQLTENTRIRLGYTNFNFSGDASDGRDAGYGYDAVDHSYQMIWTELYAQF